MPFVISGFPWCSESSGSPDVPFQRPAYTTTGSYQQSYNYTEHSDARSSPVLANTEPRGPRPTCMCSLVARSPPWKPPGSSRAAGSVPETRLLLLLLLLPRPDREDGFWCRSASLSGVLTCARDDEGSAFVLRRGGAWLGRLLPGGRLLEELLVLIVDSRGAHTYKEGRVIRVMMPSNRARCNCSCAESNAGQGIEVNGCAPVAPFTAVSHSGDRARARGGFGLSSSPARISSFPVAVPVVSVPVVPVRTSRPR